MIIDMKTAKKLHKESNSSDSLRAFIRNKGVGGLYVYVKCFAPDEVVEFEGKCAKIEKVKNQ